MSESQMITLRPWPTPEFRYCFSHQLKAYASSEPEKPHIHDSYEIYINVSGDVSFLVNNKLYPVAKGDLIVTRPGDVHICVYQSNSQHEWFCLWLSCPERSPLLDFVGRGSFSNFIRFSEETRRELLRLLYRLKDAEEKGREPARTAYIFRLLALLDEREQTDSQRPELPRMMQKTLDYINKNFVNIHSVEDIASANHISCSTLSRWFRDHLQLTPHKYLEALKLSYAQRLLLEGRSVTEVCNSSGFTDCSRFISVFKSRFGQTPLQYQKSRER